MKVQFTETVLRDAGQSLIATRLPYSKYEDILGTMDNAGYFSLECWGGATFDTCLRFLDENPWERLRAIYRANSTNVMMAALLSVDSFSGYAQARDVMERVARHDTELLRQMDAELAAYDTQRLELEAQIGQLNADLAELEENRLWCEEQMAIARQTIEWADLQIAQSQQAYLDEQVEVAALEAALAASPSILTVICPA